MKILIVDDSKAMRLIIMRTLRQAGFGNHTLFEAQNGRDALRVMQQNVPDLILCDWNMPDMSGISLLEMLRTNHCDIRFGFITSEASFALHKVATEAGASFVLTKPFTPEQVQDTLGPILA